MRFSNQVAIVTGGGGGLGKEIALALAEDVYLASDDAKGITGQSLSAVTWNREHGIHI